MTWDRYIVVISVQFAFLYPT